MKLESLPSPLALLKRDWPTVRLRPIITGDIELANKCAPPSALMRSSRRTFLSTSVIASERYFVSIFAVDSSPVCVFLKVA